MSGVAVEIENVSRTFTLAEETVYALRDVTIHVAPGDFLALIGRSGSGKTTLLNLIAGLDRPTSGTIQIDGQEIGRFSDQQLTELRRKRIGFIFQSFGLLPLLSALENVELAMRIAGAGRRDRGQRSREVLEMMGLGRRANHRPYELSGGEQQRVAIARAIANRPALILADEPTGELDSSTATAIFRLLRDVARSEGITIITSTHDRTVMELAGRVEELADGRVLSSANRHLFEYATTRGGTHFRAPDHAETVPGTAAVVEQGSGIAPMDEVVATKNDEAIAPHETDDAQRWSAHPTSVLATPAAAGASAEPVSARSEPDQHSDEPAEPSREEINRWAPPERRPGP